MEARRRDCARRREARPAPAMRIGFRVVEAMIVVRNTLSLCDVDVVMVDRDPKTGADIGRVGVGVDLEKSTSELWVPFYSESKYS